MSEETQETNDGTWSGLKKTIIGAIATAVTAGGAWFTSTLFGGGDDEDNKPKTEQAAPAPVINLNVDNSSKNTSSSGGGTTTIIKEKTVEKPAQKSEPAKPEKKSESEDAPW
jgi:hypothetical protein